MSEKISLSNPQFPGQQVAQPEAVPSEAVALPSEGKLYPPGHALHNKQFVEIKPMTARDEDVLTSRALFKTGKVIDTLLRNCIIDKNIDTSKLLVGDRNAAIIGIRVSGYGADYSTRVDCPGCGTKTNVEVDLGSLPLRNIPEDAQPIAPFTNEFLFKLKSGKNVTFKLPTGADEAELSMLIDRLRKTTGTDSLVTSRLMQQIVSIDGETDRNKLAGIIRNIPAMDSRDLRLYMDYCAPDVSLIQKFTCDTCGFETEEIEVPLGTEFFWPSARR